MFCPGFVSTRIAMSSAPHPPEVRMTSYKLENMQKVLRQVILCKLIVLKVLTSAVRGAPLIMLYLRARPALVSGKPSNKEQ